MIDKHVNSLFMDKVDWWYVEYMFAYVWHADMYFQIVIL